LTVLDNIERRDARQGLAVTLKRAPTPSGPITELFDRLHELHLYAGEPGVRQIARGMGTHGISYTTVHNTFKGPKVPRWDCLRLVVEQLNGDVEQFHALWTMARTAEQRPTQVTPSSDAGVPPQVARPVNRRFAFVQVTYRLPFDASGRVAVGRWQKNTINSPSLDRQFATRGGVWIGWAEKTAALPAARSTAEGVAIEPVELPSPELEQHYEGYCNSTIWPLYHNSIERPEFQPPWEDANRLVNERFADAVSRIAARGATVWIHDYHLQLVPAMLRRGRPDLRIGFFLHIPFPPPELFAYLPDRDQILRGLLGADLVGFQRASGAENFLHSVKRLLRLPTSGNLVLVGERRVTVDAFPISVDTAAVEQLAGLPRVQKRAARIRTELGTPRTLLLGIDRLDYTKGIEQRLEAYGQLLATGALSADSSVFVQVVIVSRERLVRYAELRERVDRLAGRLNGTYGRVGNPVVHYINRVHDIEEMVALYAAADVMVVTPLSDGMNLVSKEYVASRVDNRGALVLSEFAGAATELREALLVNPNDIRTLKNAILLAATMDTTEQERRMDAMRWQIRKHDVHAWATTFLNALHKTATAASTRSAS
jgi:trehalose 6-phosphate synthase